MGMQRADAGSKPISQRPAGRSSGTGIAGAILAMPVGLLIMLVGLSACTSSQSPSLSDKPEIAINAKSYGTAWPYPVYSEGKIRCRIEGRPMALIEMGGVEYGLNGAAMGVGGYADPRPMMRRNDMGTYDQAANSSAGEMLRLALSLCDS